MRYIFTVLFAVLSIAIFGQAPGCPNVTISAPGIVNGQVTIACNQCINLTANILHTGFTNTYTVSSIPYAPPFPYNSGNAIFVDQDDIWSGVINLPFKFCYFGTNYNQLVVGANGCISFNLSYAGQSCPWSFSANCPNSALPLNTIFGPYHDIDPSVGGAIYEGVLGTYPCRTYVVNYNQVPMFSCNNLIARHQIVLYEATNVIEVYIQSKPLCSSWNSGRAIVGVQNQTGNAGYVAPGRNATPTWTATNEAWRFTPNGNANYTIQWYQGSVPVGVGATINVCNPGTYTSVGTYDNCDFNQVVVTDEVIVNSNQFTADVTPDSANLCPGGSTTLTATCTGTPPYTFQWSPNSGISSTSDSVVTVTPAVSTTYTLTVTDGFGCTQSFSVPINIIQPPVLTITPDPNPICDGNTSLLTVSGASSYLWDSGQTTDTMTVSPLTPTTYSVTGTDQFGCTSSSSITIQIYDNPVISLALTSPDICVGENSTITASGANTYVWNTNDSTSQITVSPAVTTTYQVTGTSDVGCSSTSDIVVNVHELPIIDFTAQPTSGCIPLNIKFNSIITGGSSYTYLWSFGTNGFLGTSTQSLPNKSFNHAGNHDITLTVTTEYNCSNTLTKPEYISAYPNPVASFTANPPSAELGNSSIDFIDNSSGASYWNWNFGDGATSFEQNPIHTYITSGVFNVNLLVMNEYSCKDEASGYVNIIHNLSFYVPQAFSPNGDGFNDEFGPVGIGIDKLEFFIYDRWGKEIFVLNDINQKWDGRINGKFPDYSSEYIWKAKVKYVNGIVKDYFGTVLLYW